MYPTFVDGDSFTVVSSIGAGTPRRFDVVLVEMNDGTGQSREVVKRVVGLPGETIEYVACSLYIDSQLVFEDYVDVALQAAEGCGSDQSTVLVPADSVFLLGDNRGRSSDSRVFGPIPISMIVGSAAH